MKITTDWLKEHLNLPKNHNLVDSMTSIGLEVESYKKLGKESVIDLDVTPNRSDCLSVYGIARDLAAKFNLKVKGLDTSKIPIKNSFKIINKIDHKIAPVYSGLILRNFDNRIKTPAYIVSKLKACGISRINFIVDLINFIMIEIGQPMHAFDMDKLSGEINVRNSKKGEIISCLDGKSYELASNTPLITDNSGPVAIAGVIGGQLTAVDLNTKSVFVESAYFTPDLIRLSSKSHRIQTDSSQRFERGVDPLLPNTALKRLVYLVSKELNIKTMDITASTKTKLSKKNRGKISIPLNTISDRLGIEIKEKFIINTLKRLGFSPKKINKDTLQTIIPTHRFDISQQNDLVEEIARMYGYDNFPSTLPSKIVHYEIYKRPMCEKIADSLISRGYNEVINYAFIPKDSQIHTSRLDHIIKLINPISEDKAEMRTSMVHSLLKNVSYNKNRQKSSVKFFEIGKTYSISNKNKILEKNMIAGVVTGLSYPKNFKEDKLPATFYDVKGDILSILPNLQINRISAESYLKKDCQSVIEQGVMKIGTLGQIDRKLLAQYDLKDNIIYFEIDMDHVSRVESLKINEFSIYPKVKRDLTVICGPSYISNTLINKIREKSHKYMINIRISDIFYNDKYNVKNITLELIFQAKDRTLVDRDVTDEMSDIVSIIENELKLKIKS